MRLAESQLDALKVLGWRVHRLTAFAGAGELVILTLPGLSLPIQGMGPLVEVVPALYADAARWLPDGGQEGRELLTARFPGCPSEETEPPPPLFDVQLTLPELVPA